MLKFHEKVREHFQKRYFRRVGSCGQYIQNFTIKSADISDEY